MPKNLVKKIQNTTFQHNLFKKNDKIILAVSGGPDSVAMLDIFSKLQKKYNLGLIVAHVNYELRGRDSDRDEKFVRELAKKYNIEIRALSPCLAGRRASLSRVRERGQLPSENELRDIRYAFFEKLRTENKLNYIAIAHNADDQVETYLMRVIRGAGLKGLSAMRHKNNNIIRPLLDISRREILDYLKKNKLAFRIDKTNLESKYNRNKIRNKLLPYLEKNFNPSIRKTILNSVESIAEDQAYLNKLGQKAYRRNTDLDIQKLLALHPALQKRVLLEAIAQNTAGLQNIEASAIRELLKAIRSTKSKNQIVVMKGLKIERKSDRLEIKRV